MDSSQPSDRRASSPPSPGVGAPLSASPPRRRTLPPPEWLGLEGPRSAASIARERYLLESPVARRIGARAELSALVARMEAASRNGDEAAERVAATTLARALAAAGTELDQATKLARRSLILGEDSGLREELASWFAMLGEPALAAATLRPLLSQRAGAEAGQVALRIGALLARAGEVRAARAALELAMRDAANEATPFEMAASMGAFAPELVLPEESASLYLEAAARRGRSAERAAAFEDVLRAFEIAPGARLPAERLSALLRERNRIGAADEVSREHARHAGPNARNVHLLRKREAVEEHDLPRALGAAFDAGLDAEIDLESALGALGRNGSAASGELGFDELLERLGLYELLAARLELACDLLIGSDRARARVALGRLYFGALSRPDRAVENYLDALESDPSNSEARLVLVQHAGTTHDYWPLVEALVRVGEGSGSAAIRQSCLTELYELAEARQEPTLMLWAVERLATLSTEPWLSQAIDRLSVRVQVSDQALSDLQERLSATEGADRIEPLRGLATQLLGRPGSADALLPVLLELVELAPDERSFQVAVERLLGRQGRLEELEAFYGRLLSRAGSPPERARMSLLLASARRRRGDLEGALEALAPVIEEAGAYPAALAMLLLLSAQRGDELSRARALLRLSTALSAPLKAVLCAFAGEALLRGGQLDAARRAVDQAVAADPSMARPAAARAAVGVFTCDRWGAQAIERAMGVAVPRAALCAALADAYDKLDEPALAFAFCLRRITLRPGDPAAARDRLERAIRSAESTRISDTLSWLFSQPQPLTDFTELVAKALRVLAPLDAARGAALARRALDVMGPRSTDLRLAVLAVADVVGERGLAIAALERWLAAGAPAGDHAELLLDLARRRRAAGDADGAARALMRAIREGAWATSVLAELDVAEPPRTSDGELALLFARAEALSALSEADQRGTAMAWRELGAAYWDLAGDERSALAAWERAASLDPERGIESLASDLLAFGGPEFSLSRLEEFAARRSDPSSAARVFGLAASMALETGRRRRALELAMRALDRDPSRSDVLAVVERSVDDTELEVLDGVYTRLAESALGRYGERAVHYRAARQFEKRDAFERALAHALRAFEAVPSEGVVCVTLFRLAQLSSNTAAPVEAFERVAQETNNSERRAAWLRRAAQLAGPSEEGLSQRLDVLLRALSVQPDLEIVASLGQTAAQLCQLVPAEKSTVELRLTRALDRLSPQLAAAAGARVAIAFARLCLEIFEAAPAAVSAVECAVACDAEVEEYRELIPFIPAIAPAAGGLIDTLLSRCGASAAGPGAGLFELGARCAESRGELANAARLSVEAAILDSGDQQLARVAERSARAHGDAALIARLLENVELEDRAAALIDMSLFAEREGKAGRAIELLEQARKVPGISRESARRLFSQLIELYERSDQGERALHLLEQETREETEEPERRAELARQLAAALSAKGEVGQALAVLEEALIDRPRDAELFRDFVALSRTIGDYPRLCRGLSGLLEHSEDSTQRQNLLREIAELYQQSGDHLQAARLWTELLELNPNDVQALGALEREAERTQDYDALVKLLARRAVAAKGVEEVRRIRLRRASVLEQRLGRADEARAELEALTAATGDHLGVLRVLADLDERLGTPLRAAPLWLRASAVTPDRDEAADLSCRACEAYLLGGDVDSARRVLDAIEIWAQSERVLTLAAEIERRRGNPLALADALDDLADASTAPPERRAALLTEAAEASLSAGQFELALTRALRAARLAPLSVSAQLLARSLEYRRRGSGSADDAEATVNELAGLNRELLPEDAELFAFLLAEALEAMGRGEDAGGELERAEHAIGRKPLISLALGERFSRAGDLDRALSYFDAALGGDLRALRGRGRVAWHAAEIARALGDLDRAASYLEVAAEDPDTRQQANARVRELFAERVSLPPRGNDQQSTVPPPSLDRSSMRPPPEPSSPPRSGKPSFSLERATASAGGYSKQPPPEVAEERISLPLRAANPNSPLAASVLRHAEAAEAARLSAPAPEAEESAADTTSRAPGRYSLRTDWGPGSISASTDRTDPSSTQLLALKEDEAPLYEALSAGVLDAGRELIDKLEQRGDRTHDLVAVCRRMLTRQPTDSWSLARLHRAALLDKNPAYARAVEHVMAVLEPSAAPVEPPPLSEQTEQPDALRVLLLRDHASPAFEALSLVWEGAEHLFRREPSTYGVTGLERVPLAAPTPLGRTYAEVARALGMLRTPLFLRRSASSIQVTLALLSPPSVVVSGDVRHEKSELRFELGAKLLAATPSFALLLGSSEAQARSVLRGLAFAFGPPQAGGISTGTVPGLAESLWESIPARLQRRLRELCKEPAVLEYEAAIRLARSAARRAGLFACGDLSVALAETCAEDGISPQMLKSQAALANLAASNPSIRSLLQLATSPEYAQIRWQPGRAAR